MGKLRNRIRNSYNSNLPLAAAAYLAKQMLTCIKGLHQRGYVHRDVKPSNFVRQNKNSTIFSIVDFGITKHVRIASYNCCPLAQVN